MAMNGPNLGTEIYDALVAAGLAVDDATARDVWDTIGTKLVAHIQTNAQINTTVTVTSVTGVTTGAGVSGPGTGTGTGTIS